MTKLVTEPWPVGRWVKKVRTGPGDEHPKGAKGKIVRHWGEARLPETGEMVFGYAIRWEGENADFLIFNDGRLELLEEEDVGDTG